MTLQTIFDRCMLGDNELDLIAGGDDVVRGLTAVNMVQDWWEAVAAAKADFLATHSTFTTTADVETTTWPSTLKRLDGDPWLISSVTDRSVRQIARVQGVGGHVVGMAWPYSELSESVAEGSGSPREYWATGPGGLFYWTPIPDAIYTVRAYGLWAKADYTAAANTFAYPDEVALVIPTFAAKLMRVGLNRNLDGIQGEAEAAFSVVVKALKRFTRQGADSLQYSEAHDT